MGSQAFLHHKRSVIKLIVLVIMIIEAVVVLGRQTSHFRVTRALRPVFLIDNHYCKGIRRVIRQIMQSLPPILDMLTLLLFFMLIFSVLGFYLFVLSMKILIFHHYKKAFVSLFVLLTTANFPDVMMPSYAMTKMVFTILYNFHHNSCVLLMNLIQKKTGYLTMSEFLNVFEAGPLKWKPKRPDDLWFAHFQGISLKFFTGINKLVTHHMTDLIINAVVAINGVWQIMEASEVFDFLFNRTQSRDTYYEECDAVSCETTEDIYGWVSIAFVAFYTVEVSLKIIGLGVIEYFSSKWNRFDFGVTFLAICGLIAEQFRFPFSFVTILRTLRLLRLFKLKKRYRDVLGTLFIILPRFLSVAFVLVILYYFFGIIAMEVLSGYNLVNCNTTVEQFYHFDNDTSLDGYYYLNNFDDFITSQITLFELMVVNNWFIIMNGYASVATEWSRLFFMSFYIVTMVVINIVVAFVLKHFSFEFNINVMLAIWIRNLLFELILDLINKR
ncbi:two pore calcium channel protein 1 [Caerostris extrusa]|uniref:Two pore calcium channel protein 1 n=1 Tax=Caerostris extrusa TaxID=172846 RepID=A0AAV4TJ26_CAEEX|nr:two pore calcium channel protein 1 [Caerostris extrusa]